MAQNSQAQPLILIVDDDAGLRRLMQKSLEREGFATAATQSGKETTDWLSENKAALMLLDLKLPDIEGRDLIQELEQAKLKVPFIVVTGQGDERVAVEMMKSGALDYLVKDAQFMDLVPTVAQRALQKLETEQRLAAAQAELSESKTQMLMVSEREQRLFGAELHDNLGQQLTAIELRCHTLLQNLPPDRKDLQDQVSEIGKSLREAISHTRSLAHGLAPINVGAETLEDALLEMAERINRSSKLKCAVEAVSGLKFADDLVSRHLFRIAQEAVTNAVKHSRATRVTIRLTEERGAVRLEISDNGKGLRNERGNETGIGLSIMKHRASVIGGELEIASKAGKGLTVICTLPASDES